MELHVVAATEALCKGVVLDLQLRDLKGRKRSRVSASPRHILGQRDRGWHTQGRWHGRGNAACRSSSHPSAQALTTPDGPFPGMLHRKNISCQQPVASPACPIAHMWDCTHTFFSGENLLSDSSYVNFGVGTEGALLLREAGMEVGAEQIPTSIFVSMHRQEDQNLSSQSLHSHCHPLGVSEQLSVLHVPSCPIPGSSARTNYLNCFEGNFTCDHQTLEDFLSPHQFQFAY